MNAATSLLVHTAPEPFFGDTAIPPEQIPLPLAGFPQLRLAPAPAETGVAESLRQRASTFMQILVEVLTGERPSRQLGVWMSPEVYQQLQRRLLTEGRAPRYARLSTGTRIASVHVAMVTDTTAEIAARMTRAGRSRALAVRLELQTSLRGVRQWHCTALTWA
jgi:hypothetical protein